MSRWRRLFSQRISYIYPFFIRAYCPVICHSPSKLFLFLVKCSGFWHFSFPIVLVLWCPWIKCVYLQNLGSRDLLVTPGWMCLVNNPPHFLWNILWTTMQSFIMSAVVVAALFLIKEATLPQNCVRFWKWKNVNWLSPRSPPQTPLWPDSWERHRKQLNCPVLVTKRELSPRWQWKEKRDPGNHSM